MSFTATTGAPITKRLEQIGIILSLAFALLMNFLIGANVLNLPAINQISDRYATLLTPAGYAFAIWSIIYTLLIVLAVYQARDIFKSQAGNNLPQKLGALFVISNICNGVWTYIFVKEWLGLSVAVLLILTACLYTLLARLRIATYDAPAKVIVCVWWPLLIYTGWVSIASIVNIASWLQSVGVTLSPVAVCILLVIVGAGLVLLLIKRNVRELLLASIWAIVAIGVEQIRMPSGNHFVATTAFAVAGILFVAVGSHAYKNRQTNIIAKLFGSH